MRSVLVLCLLACSPAIADNSKSASTTEVRDTGSFSGISITTVLEVELAVGSTTRVELRGPAAWLPRVETAVKDGVLVMSMPGKWKKIPKLKAVITTPSLSSVSVSGVASLEATGLSGKSLAVELSGAGELDLAGAVDAVTMTLSGAAEIDADELITRTTNLSISGTGSVELHVTKQLDVDISGVGAVTVHGKPKINKQITGTGAIDVE